MIDILLESPVIFLVWVASLLSAITIHEFSHAWMADRLGDPTPRIQGRLTLNPLAHLDPLGTIMLLVFRFGWGKPVVFDPYNLENPRRGAAVISLAGPASNVILALGLSLIFKATNLDLLIPFIFLNVALAVFNMIPIHPLDGGKILVGLLPAKDAREADMFLNRYGLILLLFMILPIWGGNSMISVVITPVLKFVLSLLVPSAGSLI